MKRTFTIVTVKTIFLYLLPISSIAQLTIEWAVRIGGSNNDAGRSIEVDGSGNIYNIGTFANTANFGTIQNNNLTSLGFDDVYVSKFDSYGSLQWAISFGGSGMDFVNSTAIDSNNDIYITGYFQGTVDFNPGLEIYNLSASGSGDIFILKLTSNGEFAWAKRIGNSTDLPFSYPLIEVDIFDDIYLSASFLGLMDLNPGTDVNDVQAYGKDIFITKLNNQGEFIWSKNFGGTYSDEIHAITSDTNGTLYLKGNFSGNVDFNPNEGEYYLNTDNEHRTFILSLNPNGDFNWVKRIGGSISTEGSIKVDSDKNVYVMGYFFGTADFDPGSEEYNLVNGTSIEKIYIVKLNPDGEFIWAKMLNGTLHSNSDKCFTINYLSDIFIIGFFSVSADFDPSINNNFLHSSGGNDVLIFKFDANGNYVRADKLGGSGNDKGSTVHFDNDGALCISGSFSSTVNFNFDTDEESLTSTGGSDAFLAKYTDHLIDYTEEKRESDMIKAYPNPVNTQFNLSIPINGNATCFKIIDTTGRTLNTTKINNSQKRLSVDMGDYKNGIYFVQVNFEDGTFATEQITKQ